MTCDRLHFNELSSVALKIRDRKNISHNLQIRLFLFNCSGIYPSDRKHFVRYIIIEILQVAEISLLFVFQIYFIN